MSVRDEDGQPRSQAVSNLLATSSPLRRDLEKRFRVRTIPFGSDNSTDTTAEARSQKAAELEQSRVRERIRAAGSASREARAEQNAENARRLAQGLESMGERQRNGQQRGNGQMRAEANARGQQLRQRSLSR